MTKRKAIEAARHRSKTDFSGPSYLYTEASLGWLWGQARIAGLREAINLAVPLDGDSCEYVWDGMARIRKQANQLAKKARTK
jgi:hypothetical protein